MILKQTQRNSNNFLNWYIAKIIIFNSIQLFFLTQLPVEHTHFNFFFGFLFTTTNLLQFFHKDAPIEKVFGWRGFSDSNKFMLQPTWK